IVIKDDGKGIKSIIQFYIKERARLHKIYKKQSISKGEKLKRLIDKFENKKLDQLHKISKLIVQECERKSISVLVIGYNPEWKQNVQLGRKINQSFVSIPYHQLIEKITCKAEERGIMVKLINESYTSKCSFLDNEPVRKHSRYIGKRISRGVFCSSNGLEINADVNAAYNILLESDPQAIPLRKVCGVGGYLMYPFSWKLS
ncbi:MAG: transposase, partial [Candidatus Heimdallarchaeota archaeon]|nr:transposase [Candidatus Heimdallarchaeota archaeon]